MKRAYVLLLGLFLLLASSAAASAAGIEERLAALQKQGTPVFMEVGSEACVICYQMKPVLQKLSEEYKGKLEVMSLDVAEDDARAFALKHGVRVLPTQLLFDRNGKEFDRHYGFFSYEEVKETLKKISL